MTGVWLDPTTGKTYDNLNDTPPGAFIKLDDKKEKDQ